MLFAPRFPDAAMSGRRRESTRVMSATAARTSEGSTGILAIGLTGGLLNRVTEAGHVRLEFDLHVLRSRFLRCGLLFGCRFPRQLDLTHLACERVTHLQRSLRHRTSHPSGYPPTTPAAECPANAAPATPHDTQHPQAPDYPGQKQSSPRHRPRYRGPQQSPIPRGLE